MPTFQFRVNPRASELGKCSALLNGVARQYRVDGYSGTLSVKSVQRGAALYFTRNARHLVTEDFFLILNHEQEYAMEFQSPVATETLCPFFQPGFVEQVAFSLTTPVKAQLDEIEPAHRAINFCERLYERKGRVGVCLNRLSHGLKAGRACGTWLEDKFYEFGEALIELGGDVQREIDALHAQRPATREELYRRLHRGRDYLLACYTQPVTVAVAASAAMLSPYHFHRQFKSLFGHTPMQLVQRHRLAIAARLLRTTDLPVTQVCFEVGFEGLGSFCSLFRRRLGCSPRQYRERQKNR